jgi:NADPH:quinone reductase-like Zn-dependent oxidoreductase
MSDLPHRMRAVVFDRFGPPERLRCAEVQRPSPRHGELLVRVAASAVTSADLRIRGQDVPNGFGLPFRVLYGFHRPRQPVLGSAFAGTVVAVGPGVSRWRAGDAVFGMSGMRMGAHAAYVCVAQSSLVCTKPEDLSFEEAASLPFGGTAALSLLRRAGLSSGDRILVNGASGAVGSAAVQLAHAAGAHVTGVCSARNAGYVRFMGADEVIDYTREDFTVRRSAFDVLFDVACSNPLSKTLQAARQGGRCIRLQASLPEMLTAPWHSLHSRRRVIAGIAEERCSDLEQLVEMTRMGCYKPLIGAVFEPERAVEAHRAAASGSYGTPVLLRFF